MMQRKAAGQSCCWIKEAEQVMARMGLFCVFASLEVPMKMYLSGIPTAPKYHLDTHTYKVLSHPVVTHSVGKLSTSVTKHVRKST